MTVGLADSGERPAPAYPSPPLPSVRKRRRSLMFFVLWVSVACASFFLSEAYKTVSGSQQGAPSQAPRAPLAMSPLEPASAGISFGPIERVPGADVHGASSESASPALSEAPQVSRKRAGRSLHKRAKHGARLKRDKHKALQLPARGTQPSA